MTKLLLPYNKSILKTNVIFSIILAFISTMISGIYSKLLPASENPVQTLIHQFASHYVFWIMTGGFLLSVYYFEVTRKNEFYFYYNLGIGKIKLLLFTFALHLLFILPILYILKYV